MAFTQLPTELIIEIFSTLRSTADALALRSACRRMNEVWRVHATGISSRLLSSPFVYMIPGTEAIIPPPSCAEQVSNEIRPHPLQFQNSVHRLVKLQLHRRREAGKLSERDAVRKLSWEESVKLAREQRDAEALAHGPEKEILQAAHRAVSEVSSTVDFINSTLKSYEAESAKRLAESKDASDTWITIRSSRRRLHAAIFDSPLFDVTVFPVASWNAALSLLLLDAMYVRLAAKTRRVENVQVEFYAEIKASSHYERLVEQMLTWLNAWGRDGLVAKWPWFLMPSGDYRWSCWEMDEDDARQNVLTEHELAEALHSKLYNRMRPWIIFGGLSNELVKRGCWSFDRSKCLPGKDDDFPYEMELKNYFEMPSLESVLTYQLSSPYVLRCWESHVSSISPIFSDTTTTSPWLSPTAMQLILFRSSVAIIKQDPDIKAETLRSSLEAHARRINHALSVLGSKMQLFHSLFTTDPNRFRGQGPNGSLDRSSSGKLFVTIFRQAGHPKTADTVLLPHTTLAFGIALFLTVAADCTPQARAKAIEKYTETSMDVAIKGACRLIENWTMWGEEKGAIGTGYGDASGRFSLGLEVDQGRQIYDEVYSAVREVMKEGSVEMMMRQAKYKHSSRNTQKPAELF